MGELAGHRKLSKLLKLLRMETELFASVEAGDLDKFKELIKKETKETIDQVDFYGYTALHAAAENNRPQMIPLILDAGADINRATYDATFTALHHALANGHFDCARVLIDRGADVNLLNEAGVFGSSLHYAIIKDSEEFVKLILSKGGDVNLCSGQGFTPIYQASMANQPSIVKILLEAGADPNVPDEDDLTPLHVAARDGCGEVALILVKAGADLKAKNNEGKTASQLADYVNEQEMKNFLLKCESGEIPPDPPVARVREAPVMREIIVPEGWGPG